MNLSSLSFFLIFFLPSQIHALITLASLTTLSDLTVSTRSKIQDIVSLRSSVISKEQSVLGQVGDLGDEEENVAEILKGLNEEFKKELDKPLLLDLPVDSQDSNEKKIKFLDEQECPETISQHHVFMNATVWLIRDLFDFVSSPSCLNTEKIDEEKKGGLKDEVSTMQRVWASRSSNVQERSFIEQLLACYRDHAEGCFGKNEVLRRCVEVVEYLNDLLDAF